MATSQGVRAHLGGLIETAGVGFGLLSADDRWIEVNDWLSRLLGYSREEFYRLGRSDTTHPDDLIEETPLLERVRRGETPSVQIEERLRNKDGGAIWVSLTATTAGAPGNLPPELLFIVQDVGSRRDSQRGLSVQHLVSRIIVEATSAEETLRTSLVEVAQALRWSFAAYWAVDGAAKVLRPAHVWSAPGRPLPEFERQTMATAFSLGEGVPGRTWQLGAPFWESDVTVAGDRYPRSVAATREGLHSAFAFPIRTANMTFGVMEFFGADVLPPDRTLLNAAEGVGYQLGEYLDRARAVVAEHESEVRKGSILETALDCIITADHRGVITEFNPAAEVTFRYRRADVIGKQMVDLIIPPSYRDAHLKGMKRYLATGEAHVLGRRIEITAMRADGSEFPVELAIVRVPLPGPPFFTAYLRDLTERKKLEAEQERLLIESEEARRELEEQAVEMEMQAAEMEQTQEQMARANRELAAANEQLREKGEEVRAALAAAEEADRAKGEFLATMSHELRTPLNAISGYTELLRMGIRGPVTEAQIADLERINRSQAHLLGIINDILKFSKLEAGQLELGVEDFPLKPALDAIEELVRPQLNAKRLDYRLDAGDPEATVRGDRERVQQIVLNLVGNAVKFTPEGGRISVAWSVNADMVLTTVTDTGIGIEGTQLERIFDPFVQVAAGTTRTSEGVGLGLAISRDLARQMGGDVTVTSKLGAGSTFTLALPRGD